MKITERNLFNQFWEMHNHITLLLLKVITIAAPKQANKPKTQTKENISKINSSPTKRIIVLCNTPAIRNHRNTNKDIARQLLFDPCRKSKRFYLKSMICLWPRSQLVRIINFLRKSILLVRILSIRQIHLSMLERTEAVAVVVEGSKITVESLHHTLMIMSKRANKTMYFYSVYPSSLLFQMGMVRIIVGLEIFCPHWKSSKKRIRY